MDPEEGADASVAPRQLHPDQSHRDRRVSGAAIAPGGSAGDAEGGQLGHQLKWELGTLPVVVNNRNHLCLTEAPDPVPDRPFPDCKQLIDQVEVGAELFGDVDHQGLRLWFG